MATGIKCSPVSHPGHKGTGDQSTQKQHQVECMPHDANTNTTTQDTTTKPKTSGLDHPSPFQHTACKAPPPTTPSPGSAGPQVRGAPSARVAAGARVRLHLRRRPAKQMIPDGVRNTQNNKCFSAQAVQSPHTVKLRVQSGPGSLQHDVARQKEVCVYRESKNRNTSTTMNLPSLP